VLVKLIPLFDSTSVPGTEVLSNAGGNSVSKGYVEQIAKEVRQGQNFKE
jgi:hypothetical protein